MRGKMWGAVLALFAGSGAVGVKPDGEAPPRVCSDGHLIRVEVLNGSGVDRAGLGLAERLRELGFDVVNIGNAERSDYEQTLVLDRVGVAEYALAVAEELGVEPLPGRNPERLVEVTVVVGRDQGARWGGSR